MEMGLVDLSSKPSLDVIVLKAAFFKMMSLGRYTTAQRVATISIFGGDRAIVMELFHHLASNATTPPVVKAKTLAWLASIYNKKEQETESRQLFHEARHEFQSVNHAYGLTKLNLTEAHQNYAGQFSELEGPITQFTETCNNLFYYRGLIDSIDRLRKLADKEHLTPVSLQMSAVVEEYAEESGAQVIRLRARLDCVDAWNKQSDHSGNAINTAIEVYDSLQDTDCFSLRQKAATLAAEAYAKLKDSERAIVWSQKSMEDSRHCSRLTQSAAAVLFIRCSFLTLSGPEDAKEKYLATMSLVRAEIEDGDRGIALSMLNMLRVTLASAQKLFRVDCSEYLPVIVSCIDSLQTPQSLQTSEDISPLELHAQAVELFQLSKSSPDYLKEEKAIALIRRARQIRFENRDLSGAAMLHGLQGEIYYNMAAKSISKSGYANVENVRKCLGWASEQYSLALGFFEIYKDAAEIARYKQREAHVLYTFWSIGDSSPEKVLEKVLDGQVCSDRVRAELTALGGLNAAENKRRVQAVVSTRSGFDIALHVTTHEGMALKAWEWIQRTKARSLGDLLGSQVQLPEGLLAHIAASEEALEFYEHMRQKGEERKESQSLLKISDLIESDEHVAKMRQSPVLKMLVDLREGAPLPLSDLQQELHHLQKATGSRAIVLVDWLFRANEIWMLTVKEVGEPSLEMLPITVTEITEWRTLHMQSSSEHDLGIMTDDRDEHSPMHKLVPLIKPLVSRSHAEDILILSPTGVLHSIPLHAIHLTCNEDQIPLIERHPIVYAASITTFVQCCRRARDETPQTSHIKTFVEAYEDFAGYDFEPKEQAEVRDLMTELARETNGDSHCGRDVLWDDFSSLAEKSSMLLFHGHCDLKADEPKSQGLRLPLPAGQESDDSGEHVPQYSIYLTGILLLEAKLTPHVPQNAVLFSVPAFFDLDLRHAPHITLMACASTAQAITAGDEPLGLVTALLCAGAASVLGTMWPVESRTARAFERRFIANWRTATFSGDIAADENELQEQDDSNKTSRQEEHGKGWLNLALAVRETVLDLREGAWTKEVYHWGGFVLHGSFFCRYAEKQDQGTVHSEDAV